MKERITGAEALMRSLEHMGVKTLFGYPGGSIMPTFDALYGHRDKLNHILVRHEQGAAHAAQGFLLRITKNMLQKDSKTALVCELICRLLFFASLCAFLNFRVAGFGFFGLFSRFFCHLVTL